MAPPTTQGNFGKDPYKCLSAREAPKVGSGINDSEPDLLNNRSNVWTTFQWTWLRGRHHKVGTSGKFELRNRRMPIFFGRRKLVPTPRTECSLGTGEPSRRLPKPSKSLRPSPQLSSPTSKSVKSNAGPEASTRPCSTGAGCEPGSSNSPGVPGAAKLGDSRDPKDPKLSARPAKG